MDKLNQTYLDELESYRAVYDENTIYTPKNIMGVNDIQLADSLMFGILLTCSVEGSPYRQEDNLGVFVQLSISDLTEMANISTRTVTRSLMRLEEAGLIKRVPLFGKTNKTYTL